MRISIIGGGEIARLFLDQLGQRKLTGAEVAGLVGRGPQSRGKALAARHGVPYGVGLEALIAQRPEVVIEAASHEAVRTFGAPLLERGISFIVLSAGALSDDDVRNRMEAAARRSGAALYVPSGGIGGLDALKAACAAGADHVEITVAKPPAAWRGIPFVEKLGIDLDRLGEAVTLFEGSAREGVPHFPANVNIAAALALAGIGFDRTQMKVIADPALTRNTHSIFIRGPAGTISLRFESVPFPDNPKTSFLAAYSALAAFAQFSSPVRYGT